MVAFEDSCSRLCKVQLFNVCLLFDKLKSVLTNEHLDMYINVISVTSGYMQQTSVHH